MQTPLRTILKETPRLRPLRFDEQVFAIGSCFTEHISAKLRAARMQVANSPFGIVYNPMSIKDQCQWLSDVERKFAEGDLIKTHELWHTWLHHGVWSGVDAHDTLVKMNEALEAARVAIKSAQTIFITVGTASVYRLETTGRIVANCHKAPGNLFRKDRLSVEDCAEALRAAIAALRLLAPEAQVLLTVSPVKHLREGMVENLRSKSTLLLACEATEKSLKDVYYLPVYELVTEELRDYRFYAADMCHPNELTIDLIWDWFCAQALDSQTQEYVADAERLAALTQHRPLHPETESWRRFEQQKSDAEKKFTEKWFGK